MLVNDRKNSRQPGKKLERRKMPGKKSSTSENFRRNFWLLWKNLEFLKRIGKKFNCREMFQKFQSGGQKFKT